MAIIANAIPNYNEPINGKIQIQYKVTVIDTVNPAISASFNTTILTTNEQPTQIESAARTQIILDASSSGNGSIVLGVNDIRFS